MRRRTIVLVAALAVAAGAASLAAAQDDAGSGADAPEDCGGALEASPGTIEGYVSEDDESDPADWYRVAVPDGKVLRVDVSPANDSFLHVRARGDGCGLVPAVDLGGQTTHVKAASEGTGAVRFGVENLAGPATDYAAETQVLDQPDPAVVDVAVGPHPEDPAPEGSPAALHRLVEVTVENQGSGPLAVAGLDVDVRHDVGDERDLGYAAVGHLEPGAERTLSFEWDRTGEAGEVTVEADLDAPLDADHGNNEGREEAAVVAGAPGVGADLLNHERVVLAGPYFAGAGTSYDGDGDASAGAAAISWAPPAHAGLAARADDGGQAAGGGASTPAATAFAFANQRDGRADGQACAFAGPAADCVDAGELLRALP